MKKFIFWVFLLFLAFIPRMSVSAASLEERQKAVVETAYSYYWKGKQIQYDNSSLTRANVKDFGYDVRFYRGTYDISPEEATSQETLYFVCSSFVYNVYKEAINYSLMGDGRTCITQNMIEIKGDIVIDSANVTSSMDIAMQKKKIRDEIQAGDIIVYWSDTRKMGHAMLYIGNDQILHSTGSIYDWDNKQDRIEEKGTVSLTTLTDRLDSILDTQYSERYLILRPLKVADDNAYPITNNAKMRLQYPGLSIEKVASVTESQGIDIGQEITYTINVTNHSSSAYTVPYVDTIPDYTSYVDQSVQGADINNNQLTGNILLNPNETKQITYRVKVDSDISLYGKKIVSDSTYVAGIKAKVLEIPVDSKLSQTQLESMNSVYNQHKNLTSIYDLINTIYLDSLNINLNIHSVKDVFNSIFDSNVNSYNTQFFYQKKDFSSLPVEKQIFHQIYVSNMYAGTRAIVEYNSGVIREVRSDYLVDGDIILSYTGDQENIYLYLGQKLITSRNGQIVEISDINTISDIMQSLIGENMYTVLRPSKYYAVNLDGSSDDNHADIEDNPNTFDIVICYIFLASSCIFGIASSIIYFKQKKSNS